MSPTPGRAAAEKLVRRIPLATLVALFVFVAVLDLRVVANRPYQVDEVEHVHAAYSMSAGRSIYRDFRQPHNPLLYVVLQPAVDPDRPVESFERARWTMAGMLVLTVVLVGWCARRLSNPFGGVLAAGLALVHSTLVERGQEVRTDGPAALCFAAALAVELSGLPRLRRHVAQALFLALAFLFTNKAVFGCFAFGCLWLVAAVKRRSPRLVVLPMLVWIAPNALAVAWMAWAGNLGPFLELNVFAAAAEAAGTRPDSLRFPPGGFLVSEGARNVVFWVLALGGAIWGALHAYRRTAAGAPGAERRDDGAVFATFLGAVLFASLWLNPYPYPYLHVTVLPTLAVLAGTAAGRLAEKRGLRATSPAGAGVLLLLLGGALATSFPRLLFLGSLSQETQMEALRQVQRAIAPDDAVFDMVGLYFRPDGHYAYLMTNQTFERYQRGMLEPIPVALRRRGAVAYLESYRTGWLSGEDRRFLEEHFVHYDRNLFLLGTPLGDLDPGERRVFEVLVGKRFRYDGDGQIRVDGVPFESDFLAAGEHVIERVSGWGPDRLIMDSPPPHPWPPRPPVELYVDFD